MTTGRINQITVRYDVVQRRQKRWRTAALQARVHRSGSITGQSVKTLSTTRSRRHRTIFQSVNVNSDSVVSCSHTESGTNLPKLDRDFSLRSQHLRPPELLSSPVKLSLSDPAPHIGERLKRRETGGHTLTV